MSNLKKKGFGVLVVVLAALTVASSMSAAENPGLVKSEFIYEAAPFPSCHAATIAESKEGLVAAFFGGTHERHPDVCIWVARHLNGRWTPPVEVANGLGFGENRFPTWNPVLFQPQEGPLMLFYKVGLSPSTWWGMVTTSDDSGKTWSAPKRLPDGILGPIKNKPVQLADGHLLSGTSTEGEGGWRVHFERSSDSGLTWEATDHVEANGIRAIQPSILVHGEGRLQALGRTREGRMFQTWSEDNGRTWSALSLMSLPNPNSGTDAVTLKDGRHLLVYNHNPLNKGRKPLNVAVSTNGIDWEGAVVLEDDFSKRDGYAYPSVIQAKDGLVHIVYTWDRKRIKHAVIDPGKLQPRPIKNGAWPGEKIQSVGIEMALIPAGTFVMGNTNGDWDEWETNKVTITRPFKMSMDEVSLEQYRKFRPSHSHSLNGKATGVSWIDANAFCDWLSRREGKSYRLPTEAEWEYACRASTTNRFWSGEDPPADDAPNPWNLRGMHDGVMEWCYDWHGAYPNSERTNPCGPAHGLTRVVRGDKPDDDSRLKDEPGREPLDYRGSANRAGLPPAFGLAKEGNVQVASADVGSDASSSSNTVGGAHFVGIRIVEAPPIDPSALEGGGVSFARSFVKQRVPKGVLTQAPKESYFRKRFLLPIPPDNSPTNARTAAGFHPSIRGHNHSPALEVCPNGDLLLIIYTSNFEYEPGVSFIASRLRFGAEEWDFPEPMFDTPDVNDHAPLLFTDWKNGRMWFFWGWPKMRSGAFPFQWMTSEDSGATWSEVQFPQFTTAIGPHSRQPINSAFRDRAGTLFVASDAEKGSSVLWATSDNGRTWRDTGGRTAGRHTTFALLKNGGILGLGGKSTDIDGYMPQAVSMDSGKTWRVDKTPFPAQGVNQRPSLLRLRSGRLIFAADYQRRGNISPEGVKDRGCYVAISEDEGKSWRFKKLPGTQPHEKPEYQADPDTLGYTAMRQAQNGMIHLITTMNTPCLHFEFNEQWLLSDSQQATAELTKPAAAISSKVRNFTENWPGGPTKVRWGGTVASDGRFLLHGKEEWFSKDGQPEYSAIYDLGRKVGTEILRQNGQARWSRKHGRDGVTKWTQLRQDGTKRAESTWKGFQAEGPALLYDTLGKVTSEVGFHYYSGAGP